MENWNSDQDFFYDILYAWDAYVGAITEQMNKIIDT